jgi:hypothetical protein
MDAVNRRQAGFFSYNPDRRAYCLITVPGATLPDPRGSLLRPCSATSAGSCPKNRLPARLSLS